jgi:hypothetical protein
MPGLPRRRNTGWRPLHPIRRYSNHRLATSPSSTAQPPRSPEYQPRPQQLLALCSRSERAPLPWPTRTGTQQKSPTHRRRTKSHNQSASCPVMLSVGRPPDSSQMSTAMPSRNATPGRQPLRVMRHQWSRERKTPAVHSGRGSSHRAVNVRFQTLPVEHAFEQSACHLSGTLTQKSACAQQAAYLLRNFTFGTAAQNTAMTSTANAESLNQLTARNCANLTSQLHVESPAHMQKAATNQRRPLKDFAASLRRDWGCRISDELALSGVRPYCPRFFWAARSEWAGLRQAHCASRACAEPLSLLSLSAPKGFRR